MAHVGHAAEAVVHPFVEAVHSFAAACRVDRQAVVVVLLVAAAAGGERALA